MTTMAERRDDLLELDACLARVPMPEGLEARIIAATTLHTASPSPVRRALVVGVAFAAGVMLTVLALRDRPADPQPIANVTDEPAAVAEPATPEPVLQPALGWSLTSADCEWSQSDEWLRFEAGCRVHLAQPTMDLEIWTPTHLRRIENGVSVREGEVMFMVAHVDDPERPARVAVSGGTIEVLGTRFAISQARDAGHVDLLEGAIRFRRLDGELDAIEPGHRYHWSTATLERQAPRHDPAKTAEQPESAAAGTDLAAALAEVARLRRAGELEAAIVKLDELAREQSDARTLEVISYERGTLVERSAVTSTACESWYGHRRRFPDGRYDVEVERRIEQLQCVPE
jgi:hypothetical protein